MEERDDWRLGDEGEITSCARCGKRNRIGLTHCVICGSKLGDELEADPGSLRTLGEAMGGERRVRRAVPRNSWHAWSIAAAMLFVVVVVLTWLQAREEPLLLEDWTAASVATPTPTAAVATPLVAPTRPPLPPAPVPAAAPPAPTVLPATQRRPPRPVATARVVAPARPMPAPTLALPKATPVRVPALEPVDVPPPVERPVIKATEKPSLGTDLQDATRAYRQAVDLHNQRVDEYNALADEIQRREAWDDGEASVDLRRRLERARAAVESARVQAETLRARMESVRARYR